MTAAATTAPLPGLWQAIRSNLSVIGLTIAAGYAGKSYQMIDQAYASRLGAPYLQAHVVIAYIPFLTSFVAMVFGYAVLVLFNKAEDDAQKRQFVSGSAAVSGMLGILIASLAIAASGPLIESLGLGATDGARGYLLTQAVASALITVNVVAKYLCIASRRSHLFLIGDGVGTLLNVAGNEISLRYTASPADAFVGMALSTLTVQVLLVGFYGYTLRQYLTAAKGLLREFWARGKALITGQFIDIMLFGLIPFCYTALYRWVGTPEIMAAYNISYHVVAFVAVPLYAINATGTAWLADSWKGGDIRVWKLRLKALRMTAFGLVAIPVLILLPTMPWWMPGVFGIEDELALWTTFVLLCAMLPSTLTLADACGIRVFESPKLLAKSDFIGSYVIGMPLFVALSMSGHIKAAIVSASFASVAISASLIVYYMRNIYQTQVNFR